MMGFIDNQPVRPARSRTKGSEAREKLAEKLRPVGKFNAEEIEAYVHLGILEYAQHLIDADCTVRIAQMDNIV